jgi:lysophospholipase L1-like esterase
VSHARGTDLFVAHVEKHICPTVTSNQILGGKPFEFSAATAGPKRTQILLLGDSSTEASLPKKAAPDEPQFEDTLRCLLAVEPGLPPCDVYNEGRSGEFIRGFLDTRYDSAVKTKPQADYIFVRYGLNDVRKRDDFDANFPKDFRELIARLRKDHPNAVIIPTTVIPFAEDLEANAPNAKRINDLVRRVGEEEKLEVFDLYPHYAAEQAKAPNALNYRRYALSKVPENLRPLATPYLTDPTGKDPTILVMDNRLDPIFGHLPGWFGDRHPNLAGYNVIASATAKYLAPKLRAKSAAAR